VREQSERGEYRARLREGSERGEVERARGREGRLEQGRDKGRAEAGAEWRRE